METMTSLPIIANVSRIVTRVADRIMGDRVDYPSLVGAACVEALKTFGIESRLMYGKGAWVEVLDNHSLVWAGCWGKHVTFWVATQYGEVVDLNASVAYRKRGTIPAGIPADFKTVKPLYSPPMLWSAEVPRFYRYEPEGVAELDLTGSEDQRLLTVVLEEVREKCGPRHLPVNTDALDFPNEPILCPGRKLLDDSKGTFKLYDRALSVQPLPPAPF